jgi:hypothetical protein
MVPDYYDLQAGGLRSDDELGALRQVGVAASGVCAWGGGGGGGVWCVAGCCLSACRGHQGAAERMASCLLNKELLNYCMLVWLTAESSEHHVTPNTHTHATPPHPTAPHPFPFWLTYYHRHVGDDTLLCMLCCAVLSRWQ